jgi:hypothetical protein
MKSLFWIILALMIPISATAQSQLYFHATIDLPMMGTTDDTTGGCSTGGEPIMPMSADMEVQFDDSLPLIAGENHDTLISAMWGWGELAYAGNYTFQYDPQSHTLYNLQISAAGQYGPDQDDNSENINFAISLDSISLGVVSESDWTLAGNDLPCSYSSTYHNQYLMLTGALGWQNISGKGQTTLVNLIPSTASVEASPASSSSSIQISYLANGAVQIEGSSSVPAEEVEIFDALGHLTLRTPMDGNVAQISNLHPGYYFARLGDQVAKFIVPPR